MSDPRPPSAPLPEDTKSGPAKSTDSPSTLKEPAKKLTPEEQMEAFAEDLKENDWGHQPC